MPPKRQAPLTETPLTGEAQTLLNSLDQPQQIEEHPTQALLEWITTCKRAVNRVATKIAVVAIGPGFKVS